MENTSSTFSQSLTPPSTVELSTSTKQLGRRSGVSGTSSSETSRSSLTSRSLTWIRSKSQLSREPQRRMEDERVRRERIGERTNLAITGTTASAVKRKRSVDDSTSATSVERQATEGKNASPLELAVKRPKYLLRSVWTDADSSPSCSPTASSTMFYKPLPRPPPQEFLNLEAAETIRDNPHLFQIVTPIHVDQFEKLLETHLNPSFVESVCTSFQEGFWLWADTQKEEYPITWDYSAHPPKTEQEASFLREQRDIEISANRYSEGFGPHLLPGMYSTPVHAVPKPRSTRLRLVNDHSAGPFSLNSMIAREDVEGAKMDSISDMIGALLRYRRVHPNKTLILFKSDVSAAYCRLPLHPLWQIKQIITVDGIRHVDRCTCFGGRGSCRHYTAFMGLVLWIAIFVKLLTDLFGYIDNNFSFDKEGNVMWYSPYQCYYPTKQTRLLQLWDEIGLPHDKSKQEYAPILRIIGFMVDPNLMRVSMDEEDRARLLQRVTDFMATAPGGTR